MAPPPPAGADVVVNATSVGMGTTASPIDPSELRPGMVVADLVYQPLRTVLLADAEAAGATVVDGLGMLLHQAALAFELWTGADAPLAAMRSAVERELRERGAPEATADPD